MPSNFSIHGDEANDASWAAGYGALIGAAKWGAVTAVLGGLGYRFSPVYRATTIQFKVYIQMSGMVFGGMIEADWRLRQFEQNMRLRKQQERDRAKWARYAQEFGGKDDE